MKKYAIVLPTYVYNLERAHLVTPAFDSLANTLHDGNPASLFMIIKPTVFYNMGPVLDRLACNFNIAAIEDPPNVHGTEQTLAWGTQAMFEDDFDYVTWMGDDALFHPEWHMKLRKLIEDIPDAYGWSVYRSAYEKYHQTLYVQGDYVNVSSLCGHGMTISKEEWKAWGIDWRTGHWPSPAGDTLDIKHGFDRTEPKRWTTKVSYIEHTGRRGLHCTPDLPEYAVEFQGTGG